MPDSNSSRSQEQPPRPAAAVSTCDHDPLSAQAKKSRVVIATTTIKIKHLR